MEFSNDWLPDKHNLTMADLLINCYSVQEIPFGIPQYAQCILHGLASILFCVLFIFANIEMCRFGDVKWLLSFHKIAATLNAEALFK